MQINENLTHEQLLKYKVEMWANAQRDGRPVGGVVQRHSIGLWPMCFRCPVLDL